MATFNGSRFLLQQLDSIAGQSKRPDEIIITDDDSTDDTLEIAQRFAQTAPFRVEIHRNVSRLGSRQNFIRAISLCRHEIVAMCDQDDVWLPKKLELTSRPFEDPSVMAAIHSVALVDSDLRTLSAEAPRHWHLRGVYKPLTISPWYSPYGMSTLVRRELFSWVDPEELYAIEPHVMGHDVWAWFLASVFGNIVGIRDQLALYRQHEQNLCGAPPPEGISVSLKRAAIKGRNHYLDLAGRATMRARKLERISPAAPPFIKERAKTGTSYYLKLADLLYKRAALYTIPDRLRRRRLLTGIAFSGGYKSLTRGGLGSRAFLKDIYNCILRNRLIA
jgi:glycosyltransferase involved in cell wall biosynthesis